MATKTAAPNAEKEATPRLRTRYETEIKPFEAKMVQLRVSRSIRNLILRLL